MFGILASTKKKLYFHGINTYMRHNSRAMCEPQKSVGQMFTKLLEK